MYSEALRLLRSFHQINQSDLASSLEISRSYLSELESGKKTPSLDLLQRYASFFNIPLSTLIFFSEASSDESEQDLKVRSFLGEKAISILQWIEKKTISATLA